MTQAQQELIEAVAARFGPKAVVTDAQAIAPWLDDWRGRYRGAAAAILQPDSVEAVAAMVGLAGQHGVALVPQGGNTSMVGGATPPADGSALILSLRRMNQVGRIHPGASLIVAHLFVLFTFLSRYFIQGLCAGGMKG